MFYFDHQICEYMNTTSCSVCAYHKDGAPSGKCSHPMKCPDVSMEKQDAWRRVANYLTEHGQSPDWDTLRRECRLYLLAGNRYGQAGTALMQDNWADLALLFPEETRSKA